MDSQGLRRKDTTKGPPLRILSLDGGGVRGYSMLILLQELMHRTFVEIEGRAPKRHETPKPCDHFDLIAGTGTGGLIAIMLGRLRLDIETSKDVYVRMTKRVFETDKTFAGIPYRSTLFKASKLEDAIRDCVREHTISEHEGNDSHAAESSMDLKSPLTPGTSIAPHRSPSSSSRYSQIGSTPVNPRGPYGSMRFGNPNALLYDSRENRTKTAVTAVYKGTPKSGSSTMLRSYDSRKEPAPEFNCTIWQAGRATAATGLAFKPIQVGQHVFIDEGAGKYNPAPQILDEAVQNEWPGREVGVFISIGTGKRPKGTNQQQHLWWEGFVSSGMGDFAEARRRLIAKIEGCEETHQYMLKEHISKRNVNPENYYRLNVEVGVGEFGMNEWNRLAEISTNTRMYLARSEVQNINLDAAGKIARIHRAKLRWERQLRAGGDPSMRMQMSSSNAQYTSPSNPMAVELPADDIPYNPSDYLTPSNASTFSYPSYPDDKIAISSADDAHDDSSYPQPLYVSHHPPSRPSADYPQMNPYRRSHDQFPSGSERSYNPSPRRSADVPRTPPPLPPKSPIRNPGSPVPLVPPGLGAGAALPYPDTDGPPPVNMARKPEYGVR
ncbi:FabD/lysophospholipase-like protein [Pseudovirgaria hyperparasitica]|uniref:FabD/lysophospholipase-like protein n=1 Tax=Pseudovirgaria hyperparasitica TaxID=470096 RepID=A0A6A6WCL2_9PEZI|nr:FabD/lysophospholipase-like protein [Pseudovirgaria hyperparasitica]KAF2759919.1 FabD/lysophospholipase-like protein [Pseudovirgaria hyperparasitica]